MAIGTRTVIGAVYKHFKGGKYLVTAIGNNSNNSEYHQPMVAYVSLEGEHQGEWHFRDEDQFHEEVMWNDGERRGRFSRFPITYTSVSTSLLP